MSDPSSTTRNRVLQSHCVCGACSLRVSLPHDENDDKNTIPPPLAVDCHCPNCRKFHVAAHASYLYVPKSNVDFLENEEALPFKAYADTCQHVGPVDRLFCPNCFSKMATVPKQQQHQQQQQQQHDDGEESDKILINMGCLVDATIPENYQTAWQKGRAVWQADSQAVWTQARPSTQHQQPRGGNMKQKVTGSCACGKTQYTMAHRPMELQHCYCQLCRQYSGSAYMTWIPVHKQHMKWTTSPEPPLRRTTPHGQRHFCTHCGGVLTIVYDGQPDLVWPAAGGLDDASLPETSQELGQTLRRTCHICCIWKQSWYAIPNDGLQRIRYAG